MASKHADPTAGAAVKPAPKRTASVDKLAAAKRLLQRPADIPPTRGGRLTRANVEEKCITEFWANLEANHQERVRSRSAKNLEAAENNVSKADASIHKPISRTSSVDSAKSNASKGKPQTPTAAFRSNAQRFGSPARPADPANTSAPPSQRNSARPVPLAPKVAPPKAAPKAAPVAPKQPRSSSADSMNSRRSNASEGKRSQDASVVAPRVVAAEKAKRQPSFFFRSNIPIATSYLTGVQATGATIEENSTAHTHKTLSSSAAVAGNSAVSFKSKTTAKRDSYLPSTLPKAPPNTYSDITHVLRPLSVTRRPRSASSDAAKPRVSQP